MDHYRHARPKNPANLRAISYHNYEGNIINEALTAAGTLHHIQNEPINQCRPPNVVHAKIEGTVDLSNLNNGTKTTIRALFFIRLPVGDQHANNAAGAGRNLHTFTGPSDYLTFPIADYQNLIYSHPDSVDDTYDLLPPAFTSPRASVDVESKVMVIRKQVIKLAYNRILEQIFKNICPTFINDPFATLTTRHVINTCPTSVSTTTSIYVKSNIKNTINSVIIQS
jgi:hypothetical protein